MILTFVVLQMRANESVFVAFDVHVLCANPANTCVTGRERYRDMLSLSFRGAKVALIGYDISARETYKDMVAFVRDAKRHAPPGCVIVLVACKCDLEDKREISVEEVQAFAKENGCLHVQTSAKADLNVAEPFVAGATRWLEQPFMDST